MKTSRSTFRSAFNITLKLGGALGARGLLHLRAVARLGRHHVRPLRRGSERRLRSLLLGRALVVARRTKLRKSQTPDFQNLCLY